MVNAAVTLLIKSKYATTNKRKIDINWIHTQYSTLCILSVPSFQVLLCNTVSRYWNTIYKLLVWMYIASTIWERWREVKPLIVHEERAKWGLLKSYSFLIYSRCWKKAWNALVFLQTVLNFSLFIWWVF